MMDLPSGIRCVYADNPSAMTLDGTRIYLVGQDPVAVIDPGPAEGAHLDRIVEAIGGAATAFVLLTHGHPDHAGGAEEIARRTGAALLDPGRRYGDAPPVDRAISTDAGDILALPTPGHTADHTAYRLCTERDKGPVVFVGDLLMGEGDTTLVAAPEGDIGAYLESLQRVDALAPTLLVPTHGDPMNDPREALARFRRHRLERVDQVRKVLARQRPRSLSELRHIVYGDRLPTELTGAADASLRAVLQYLMRTGTAAGTLTFDTESR